MRMIVICDKTLTEIFITLGEKQIYIMSNSVTA